MTTASWNTPITHSTDAQFRAWGLEFSTKLAAIGLVQTADTGQINWGTATRPAINTMAGYEIWRFNDATQGSAPIFLKVEYGTGTTATFPGMFLTVATGSNGSGTLTGQSTTRTICSRAGAATDTVTNWQSYASNIDGQMFICNKMNTPTTGLAAMGFGICRTVDSAGAPTTTGFVVYHMPTTNTVGAFPIVQAVRTAATATTFTATTTGLFSFIVHGVTSSVEGSNTQAYLHWMPSPKVLPVLGVCTMLTTEAAFGTTFTTTLVGTTPRTYISVAAALGLGGPAAVNTQGMCWLYE